MHQVRNALTRHKGVGVFGSALLRHEGVRGFRVGIGCSGVIQMTRDGRRQVRVGRIGVGTVTVVTQPLDVRWLGLVNELSYNLHRRRELRNQNHCLHGERDLEPSQLL